MIREGLPSLLSGSPISRDKGRSPNPLNQRAKAALHGNAAIGRKIPNPFTLEKTVNWPSSPSPALGTQMAVKPVPAQPQFLVDIEQYIERELLEIETMGDGGNPEAMGEQRLDVFSHAFEMFISRLSTYQPLLSEIHKEYDNAVRNLRREVMAFMATKSELGTLKERTVVLVNKLKAEYTKKLREVQDASTAKDARLRQLYGEVRTAKHEMEKAIEDKEKLKGKSAEQHESSAILAHMITLKEQELTKQADTKLERNELLIEKEQLNDKILSLQREAARLAGEAEEKDRLLRQANKHNEELLGQLKTVNEKYAEAVEKLEEQADNWQSRTHGSKANHDATPRPNMEALNNNLAARAYATPEIAVSSRSTVEVVGQLYWEIDRLCAELSDHGIPIDGGPISPQITGPRSPESGRAPTPVAANVGGTDVQQVIPSPEGKGPGFGAL